MQFFGSLWPLAKIHRLYGWFCFLMCCMHWHQTKYISLAVQYGSVAKPPYFFIHQNLKLRNQFNTCARCRAGRSQVVGTGCCFPLMLIYSTVLIGCKFFISKDGAIFFFSVLASTRAATHRCIKGDLRALIEVLIVFVAHKVSASAPFLGLLTNLLATFLVFSEG